MQAVIFEKLDKVIKIPVLCNIVLGYLFDSDCKDIYECFRWYGITYFTNHSTVRMKLENRKLSHLVLEVDICGVGYSIRFKYDASLDSIIVYTDYAYKMRWVCGIHKEKISIDKAKAVVTEYVTKGKIKIIESLPQ